MICVIEKLTTRIFAEKKSVVYLKRLNKSHFVTNVKMKISIEKTNIVEVLYGPQYSRIEYHAVNIFLGA